MTRTKRIPNLVGYYIVLPSAGPGSITYRVERETDRDLYVLHGFDFQLLSDAPERRDKKQLIQEVLDEGGIQKSARGSYYHLEVAPKGGYNLYYLED